MTVTNLPAVRTRAPLAMRTDPRPLPAPRTAAHLAPVIVRHRPATAPQPSSTAQAAQVSNPRGVAYWLAVLLLIASGGSLAGLLFTLPSAY